MARNDYNWQNAGFNGFFERSIDSSLAGNLTDMAATMTQNRMQEMNFDHQQTTGSLGSKIQVGSITIDGVTGRISVKDSSGNELIRLGDLGD